MRMRASASKAVWAGGRLQIQIIWNVFVIINGLVAANPVALLFALLIAAAIIVDFVCIKIYVKTNSALFLQLENAQEMHEKVYV